MYPLLSGSGIHQDITSLFHRTAAETGFAFCGGKLTTELCNKGILLRYCCQSLLIQCPIVCITINEKYQMLRVTIM